MPAAKKFTSFFSASGLDLDTFTKWSFSFTRRFITPAAVSMTLALAQLISCPSASACSATADFSGAMSLVGVSLVLFQPILKSSPRLSNIDGLAIITFNGIYHTFSFFRRQLFLYFLA